MPRKPRFFLPGVPVHVVQRGNNRQPTFFDAEDYQGYLRWLGEGAARYGCAIHAYVLMTNHVHILTTPSSETAISRTMQYVGRRYVMDVNRKHGRSGTLWEGRYKASLIQEEVYLLRCYRYIEQNPVRAGLAAAPEAYRWSSYHGNAMGAADPLIEPHPLFLRLGAGASERRAAYRALFEDGVNEVNLEAIRRAWRSGTPLGDERFRDRIGAAVGQDVGYARRGRPRNTP